MGLNLDLVDGVLVGARHEEPRHTPLFSYLLLSSLELSDTKVYEP